MRSIHTGQRLGNGQRSALFTQRTNRKRATARNQRLVWDTLAALPDEYRQPIVFVHFGGMTYRQVAAHLQLPEATVRRRIRAGMQALSEATERQRFEAP